MFLYLDLETIPTQSPDVRAMIAESVTPPARMSKPETIAAWEKNERPAAIEEAIAKTALDGTYGHVCCIGFAANDMAPDSTYLRHYTPEAEATILRDFFAAADDLRKGDHFPVRVVGHNVIGFDIRFIWQRAIVLGVRVPGWFPCDPSPWGHDAFDTMIAFAGRRGTIAMDRLCRALNIEGKGDIEGSMIGGLWESGMYDAIAKYCMADVERTRAIHRRMMIAFGEAA
jgi:hypothetical protein